MKFKEKENFSFPKMPNNFIYFLIKDNEVVYVGKTTQGIVRPLTHKDKSFDEIKIIYTLCEFLDMKEQYYIAKYKPKYNTQHADIVTLDRAKARIVEYFGYENYTIKSLKQDLNKYGIPFYKMNKETQFIMCDGFVRLIDCLEEYEAKDLEEWRSTDGR